MNQALRVSPLTEEIKWTEICPFKKELEGILEFTKAKLQEIFSKKPDSIKISELLSRPDSSILPNWYCHINTTLEKKSQLALWYLLDLVENNNLTFELFLHNLELVENILSQPWCLIDKIAINAYPKDIQHPLFKETMKNFKFCWSLIIELTEKHPWNQAEIQNLKTAQQQGVEISMDDIDPIACTQKNTSMESLDRFIDHKLQLDRHKIDGKFFQDMYTGGNIESFCDIMEDMIVKYSMKKITIEWIEDKNMYNFAQLLEERFQNVEFRYQWYYFNQ